MYGDYNYCPKCGQMNPKQKAATYLRESTAASSPPTSQVRAPITQPTPTPSRQVLSGHNSFTTLPAHANKERIAGFQSKAPKDSNAGSTALSWRGEAKSAPTPPPATQKAKPKAVFKLSIAVYTQLVSVTTLRGGKESWDWSQPDEFSSWRTIITEDAYEANCESMKTLLDWCCFNQDEYEEIRIPDFHFPRYITHCFFSECHPEHYNPTKLVIPSNIADLETALSIFDSEGSNKGNKTFLVRILIQQGRRPTDVDKVTASTRPRIDRGLGRDSSSQSREASIHLVRRPKPTAPTIRESVEGRTSRTPALSIKAEQPWQPEWRTRVWSRMRREVAANSIRKLIQTILLNSKT